MTPYTPGPWLPMVGSKSVTIYLGDDDGCPFAEVYGKDREANARLMAASPDLLAVVQRLAAWGRTESPYANLADIIHDAVAAIGKARVAR